MTQPRTHWPEDDPGARCAGCVRRENFWGSVATKKSPAGQPGGARLRLIGEVYQAVTSDAVEGFSSAPAATSRSLNGGSSPSARTPAVRRRGAALSSPCRAASGLPASVHVSTYWKCDSNAVTAHLMPVSRTQPLVSLKTFYLAFGAHGFTCHDRLGRNASSPKLRMSTRAKTRGHSVAV